jgi:S-formylglutathione hydrolase FrmB
MAYISTNIYITEAAQSVEVELLYPDDGRLVDGACAVKGVITLLHGFYGCAHDWLRETAAARYAYDNGYILVCPGCGNSFYNNMAYGPPWFDILSTYLPRELNKIFRLPQEREKNYIAGLSMGGYGAMRLGLSYPERYAAVGAFSGALAIAELVSMAGAIPEARPLFTPIFGESLAVPDEANLLKLAPKMAEKSRKAGQRFLVTCGKQDELGHKVYTQNQAFLAVARETPLDLEYREWDGLHEWAVWDRSLAEFIGFIDKSDYGEARKKAWR